MNARVERFTDSLWPMLVALVLLIAGWSAAKYLYAVEDYFVPYPWTVVTAAVRIAPELAAATWLTARAAVCGFVLSTLAGSVIAIVFAQFRLLRLGCFPYAVILQTVPIVAIAPLITYTRGPGFESVVLIAFIVSLFPIIANTTAGLTSVPRGLQELFRLNHATRWQQIWKLQIPYAVPNLITGMRTSAGLAVIGAIVGEFFAGNSSRGHGLGFMVPQKMDRLRADEAFAAVAMATLLGIAMFAAVSLLRSTLLRRWTQ
ncbi:Putative aliphatic sulfonates transport permease protein SsuC [Rosistilla ulvae]|uniref:Aliphatic sulfonates transport permease protein SsuC n=1 Tax=Rosistilla ulvae TaxID=1930277 RepID=A0A517LWS2_9BACT|nr:ABC transporter permease [Rosistilla ulvae]QDS87062.1 Putative aliphatic sulfonates transport permease protein SsuC [Rosistilla ulvae]